MSFNANFIYGVLEGLLSQSARKLNIVQVGANDGVTNDPLNQWVLNNVGLNNIALIEPQTDVFEKLKQNYAKHPSATFFNYAIGPDGYLTLYRINNKFDHLYKGIIASGITSYNKSYVLAKIKKNLAIPERDNPEAYLEAFEIQTVGLKQLMTGLPMFNNKIDFLQVDTEGFDDEVIYHADIDEFRPAVINFEFIHLSTEKKDRLYQYLLARKYKIIQWSAEDCCALKVGF